MSTDLAFVIFIIFIALVFDFINGFHDAANSIATVVGTRVLTPRKAVMWAALFNFIAVYGFELKVAATIGKGIVSKDSVNPWVILSALIGAIIWDLFTWVLGLPTSSSHALIGGLCGAAVTRAGFEVLQRGLIKVAAFIIISPLVGLVLGFAIMVLVLNLCRGKTPYQVDRVFRVGQLVSSAAYSLGHGLNDAQKTMGIIAMLLFSGGYLGGDFHVPIWVRVSCHAAIAGGTLIGGWRIVRTMGMRITKLKPVGGFCAETAGAFSLILNSLMGIPVSTTHTITGAIVGVGSVNSVSAVRWGIAGRILWAWVLTIPGAAIIAALTWWAASLLGWAT